VKVTVLVALLGHYPEIDEESKQAIWENSYGGRDIMNAPMVEKPDKYCGR